MNPTSAQHAALRILLEDVEPLLKQADEVATTLKTVRDELNADLETLGALVQRTVDAQPALLEAGRKLNGSAARIEASMGGNSAVSAAKPRKPNSWPALLLTSVGSALLSAALVTVVLCFIGRDLLEQARIGRALQLAWSSLDASTRTKVHEVIGR
jgi:ABC-type transporter Mla subunit MlaD